MMAHVTRKCGWMNCSAPHYWERLNPDTDLPFRRGRVSFFCPWTPRPPINTASTASTITFRSPRTM